MGSYTFRWEQPANEVFVSGTFDDWAGSVKLEKKGDIFEKTVSIPEPGSKVEYKYIVDGKWLTRDDQPGELDGDNYNNILRPSDLTNSSTSHIMSGVGPNSTTAALAGAVPKETKAEKDLPGAFPETPGATPANENTAFSVNPIPASEGAGNPIKLAAGEPVPDSSTLSKNTLSSNVADDADLTKSAGAQTASVNPIPASEGAGNPVSLKPGEKVPDASTFNSNTITSKVEDDKDLKKSGDEQAFGVAPIPGTSGLGNPIKLAPGEKVPDASTFTTNTIGSNVGDDKDTGAKADSLPQESKGSGAGLFGVGPVSSSIIPESSLPIGADATKDASFDPATISSVGAGSTTAALAGQVPKEPETSANTGSSVAPTSTSSDAAGAGIGNATISSVGAGSTTAALAGAVPKESNYSSLIGDLPRAATGAPTSVSANAIAEKKEVEQELLKNVSEAPVTAESGSNEKAASSVPSEVQESFAKAHASPEAAANPEAVADKKAVEAELTKATSAGAGATPASSVPAEVKDSIAAAHVSPEAAANKEAVADKSAVERELQKAVPVETAAGEPAPTAAAATSATAPAATGASTSSTTGGAAPAIVAPAAKEKRSEPILDSRDVSPMSKAPTKNHPTGVVDTKEQTQPTVTTGTTTTTAPTKSTASPSTPSKAKDNGVKESSPAPDSSKSQKKKNRLSGFFGKVKDKLHLDKDSK